MNREIKPCLVCGKKANLMDGYVAGKRYYIVSCTNCHAEQELGAYRAQSDAIRAWNRRYNNEKDRI